MPYQRYGYIASCSTSPPLARYQIVLLGGRGTWVWTTCPELLFDSKKSEATEQFDKWGGMPSSPFLFSQIALSMNQSFIKAKGSVWRNGLTNCIIVLTLKWSNSKRLDAMNAVSRVQQNLHNCQKSTSSRLAFAFAASPWSIDFVDFKFYRDMPQPFCEHNIFDWLQAKGPTMTVLYQTGRAFLALQRVA